MSVGEGSLSGIRAAAFCYYKAQPQPITASTRLHYAPPKLAPVGRQLRVLAERCVQGREPRKLVVITPPPKSSPRPCGSQEGK